MEELGQQYEQVLQRMCPCCRDKCLAVHANLNTLFKLPCQPDKGKAGENAMAEFVKHLKNTGFNVDLFKPETCIFEQFMLEREEGLFIPPWVHLPQATAAVVEEIDDTDRVLQIWSKWYTSDEYTQEQKTKIQGELDFHKVRDALHQHGFDDQKARDELLTPLLNMQSQWEQDQALAAKLQEQEYAPRQSRSARVSGRGRGKGRARGGAVKTEDGAVKTEDGAVKEEGGVKEEDDEEYEEGDESEKEDGGVQLVVDESLREEMRQLIKRKRALPLAGGVCPSRMNKRKKCTLGKGKTRCDLCVIEDNIEKIQDQVEVQGLQRACDGTIKPEPLV